MFALILRTLQAIPLPIADDIFVMLFLGVFFAESVDNGTRCSVIMRSFIPTIPFLTFPCLRFGNYIYFSSPQVGVVHHLLKDFKPIRHFFFSYAKNSLGYLLTCFSD